MERSLKEAIEAAAHERVALQEDGPSNTAPLPHALGNGQEVRDAEGELAELVDAAAVLALHGGHAAGGHADVAQGEHELPPPSLVDGAADLRLRRPLRRKRLLRQTSCQALSGAAACRACSECDAAAA